MIEIISVKPELSELPAVINFTEKMMDSAKTASADRSKTLLLMEETFVQLVKASDGKGKLTLLARKSGDMIKFRLRCQGEKFEFVSDTGIETELEEMDAMAEAAIRRMILNANAENLKLSYRHGVNTATVICGKPSRRVVKRMLLAIILAIPAGLLLRIAPAGFSEAVNNYLLSPVRTLFMNALKMIVAPMVFFSIAASVSSFSDLRELGKTGGKVITFYTFTTFVAVFLAVVTFYLFDPGELGQLQFSGIGETTEVQSFSLLDTLTNIVPSNFIQAFCDSDTLQLIFLAIIFGIAAISMGKHSERVSVFLSTASDLVVRVAEIITGALPVMIFVSIAALVFTTDLETIRSIGAMLICIIACDFMMMVFYCLIVFVLGKKNPVSFIRKAIPAWLNAFALSSSNAAMSFTMDVCDKNLKIDKSVWSFSIPLGATINMDGASIMLAILTLFFAKMCGIPISGVDIASLALTVVVLSFGCPGIPGSSILCMSVLFAQFGIPMECITLVAAADAFLDPFSTADNVFGDVVGTYVVSLRNRLVHDDVKSGNGE